MAGVQTLHCHFHTCYYNAIMTRRLVVGLIVAALLTSLAAAIAVTLSDGYYAVGSFHHDSAYYRLTAHNAYVLFYSKGLAAAIKNIVFQKDSLDIIIRLLVCPSSLNHVNGHLFVLLPFMAMFIALIFDYVYSKTASWLQALSVPLCLFAFPLIYDPLMIGIADYWKDNIASWLLGIAAVCFVRSDYLKQKPWAFLSGFFLALLTMQRSALAVYAAPLFLPLVLAGCYRLQKRGLPQVLGGIGAFCIPIFLFAGSVFMVQGKMLQKYYFVMGYAYATPLNVARTILKWVPARLGVGIYLIIILLFYEFIKSSAWKDRKGEILCASWITFGFPLISIVMGGQYNGFFAVWSVLLVFLLAVPTSHLSSRPVHRIAVVMFVIVASLLQYTISVRNTRELVAYTAPQHKFFEELTNIIMALPSPRRLAFFYDESAVLFLNHILYNRHIPASLSDSIHFVGFMSVHDSYFRARFGDKPVNEIVESVITQLEQHPRTIVVTFCDANSLKDKPWTDGQKVATPFAWSVTDYLQRSERWSSVDTLQSPYGCVRVLTFSP